MFVAPPVRVFGQFGKTVVIVHDTTHVLNHSLCLERNEGFKCVLVLSSKGLTYIIGEVPPTLSRIYRTITLGWRRDPDPAVRVCVFSCFAHRGVWKRGTTPTKT